MTSRVMLLALWLGFALAAIFFYPLAAALESDPYYLQWQPSHGIEAIVALLLLGVCLGVLLALALQSSSRRATAGLGLIALVPLLSFGAGLSRQLPIDDALRAWWESGAVRYGVPAIVTAGAVAAFLLRPAAVNVVLRRLLLALSPISLVVLWTLAQSVSSMGTVVSRDALLSQRAATQGGATPGAATCPSILALLFDELSFAYLYDGGSVRASEFPAIAAFAAGATNYLDVRAPGDETMISLPGYLAGKSYDNIRVEGTKLDYELGGERAVFDARQPGGLFATARAAGFSPEIAGYYFPYCEMLGDLADRCRSFSFYNMSGTHTIGFSPLDPIMTTFILWPRQFPLGLFKNPPFGQLQRDMVEATREFAERPLPASAATFRFVHFSVPHLPFVYTRDGYDPPFDPLRQRSDTAYVDQLHYADRLFGEIVDRMKRDGTFDRTTIVLFSDHGFRSGGRETNSRHVPFLVKRAGQAERAEVADPTPGEQLLMRVVQAGCGV